MTVPTDNEEIVDDPTTEVEDDDEDDSADEVEESTEGEEEDHSETAPDEDPELDEYEFPKLDPELAKNPALLKRAKEFENGVTSLVAKAKEREASLGVAMSYLEPLSKPETAEDALAQLTVAIRKLHGKEEEKSTDIPNQSLTDAEIQDLEEKAVKIYEKKGFQTKEEAYAYLLAKEETTRELTKVMKEEIAKATAPFRQESEKQAQERANEALAEKTFSLVKAQMVSTGFEVTKAKVLEAIKANKGVDPVKAFKAHYFDEIMKSAPKEKKPVLPKSRGTGSEPRGKGLEYSPLDALRDVNAKLGT